MNSPFSLVVTGYEADVYEIAPEAAVWSPPLTSLSSRFNVWLAIASFVTLSRRTPVIVAPLSPTAGSTAAPASAVKPSTKRFVFAVPVSSVVP